MFWLLYVPSSVCFLFMCWKASIFMTLLVQEACKFCCRSFVDWPTNGFVDFSKWPLLDVRGIGMFLVSHLTPDQSMIGWLVQVTSLMVLLGTLSLSKSRRFAWRSLATACYSIQRLPSDVPQSGILQNSTKCRIFEDVSVYPCCCRNIHNLLCRQTLKQEQHSTRTHLQYLKC